MFCVGDTVCAVPRVNGTSILPNETPETAPVVSNGIFIVNNLRVVLFEVIDAVIAPALRLLSAAKPDGCVGVPTVIVPPLGSDNFTFTIRVPSVTPPVAELAGVVIVTPLASTV